MKIERTLFTRVAVLKATLSHLGVGSTVSILKCKSKPRLPPSCTSDCQKQGSARRLRLKYANDTQRRQIRSRYQRDRGWIIFIVGRSRSIGYIVQFCNPSPWISNFILNRLVNRLQLSSGNVSFALLQLQKFLPRIENLRNVYVHLLLYYYILNFVRMIYDVSMLRGWKELLLRSVNKC